LGLNPYLQETKISDKDRALKSFAAAIRIGDFGHGRIVRSSTVSTALSAVNTTIAMATETEPLKLNGKTSWLPEIGQMLEGWEREDGPVEKKMPVEIDVLEFLVKCGLEEGASEKVKAVGDLTLIAFFFLLRIGEYTSKGTCNETKRTVQFRIKDVMFFKRNKWGRLRQLPGNVSDEDIMNADAVTLKLDNQKNGWKGVCISHHSNGEGPFDPVRAVGSRYVHMRQNSSDNETWLSAVFVDGARQDFKDSDIRAALKMAAGALDYPAAKGIPVAKVDTHSLRIGGANALSLSGYSKKEIQKMGRWRGETFLEYIRESLCSFSEGMWTKMKKNFGFVSLEGGVYDDVTESILESEYNMNPSAACA
jgi:hypothetical protein